MRSHIIALNSNYQISGTYAFQHSCRALHHLVEQKGKGEGKGEEKGEKEREGKGEVKGEGVGKDEGEGEGER